MSPVQAQGFLPATASHHPAVPQASMALPAPLLKLCSARPGEYSIQQSSVSCERVVPGCVASGSPKELFLMVFP